MVSWANSTEEDYSVSGTCMLSKHQNLSLEIFTHGPEGNGGQEGERTHFRREDYVGLHMGRNKMLSPFLSPLSMCSPVNYV